MKEDYSDFRYYLSVTHELVLNLLGMGSSVEVVKPEGLRNEVLKETWGIINRYKKEEEKLINNY